MAIISIRRLGDLDEVTVSAPLTIGVIADTHIPTRARALPPAALAALAGSDVILHAGDIVELDSLEPLQAIAPVVAVIGNKDRPSALRVLPLRAMILAGPWRIGLVHGHGTTGDTVSRAKDAFPDAHAVVFGHSHQALCRRDEQATLLFNPGSATDRRRSLTCSVGRLAVTLTGIDGTIVEL